MTSSEKEKLERQLKGLGYVQSEYDQNIHSDQFSFDSSVVSAYQMAVSSGSIPCAPLNNVAVELKKISFISELKANGFIKTVKLEPLKIDHRKLFANVKLEIANNTAE